MRFFKDNTIDEGERRDVAFQTVVGMRDAISLATKQQQPPTYEQILGFLYDLDFDLYNDVCHLIMAKNDNDIVKYYREEAKLQSVVENKEITPVELINAEIGRLKELTKKAGTLEEDMKFINKKIAQLYSGLKNLEPRRLSENRILNRDYSKIDRSHYVAEKEFENDFYIDYRLPSRRTLRIRLLHPDEAEHITGADLVYEQYDHVKSRARFVFLQYKTWEDGCIYFSQHKNLEPQLLKMKATLCDNGFCGKTATDDNAKEYRFPYCAGFLRPTDKLQHDDSKMISSGLHLPVCHALEIARTSTKIEKSRLKDTCLSHKHFEELFNLNMLGSRWIGFEELELFYKRSLIIQNQETIKIFAREFIE